jgi:nicotinamide mononucleotide transporter
MSDFFSVNSVFFTLLGYPMSYLEFFGTLFNLWAVWLVARNRISNWPVGMVGIALFAFQFYQIQLYSDLLEQIYFFTMSIYGWWSWSHPRSPAEEDRRHELRITSNTRKENAAYLLATMVGTALLGAAMVRIHLWLPGMFPRAASFPFLDALTTVMSVLAMILQARRRIENWYYWIAVDVLAIDIYFAKNVRLVALLYFIFLLICVKGLLDWRREWKETSAEATPSARGIGPQP